MTRGRRDFGLMLMGAAFAVFGMLVMAALFGCDMHGSGPYSPRVPDDAACDTLQWTSTYQDSVLAYYFKITCVYPETTYVETPCDTVFVPAPPETVYVPVDIVCPPCQPDTLVVVPDWSCVEDCLAINGLGHWRECLMVCVPAR